ncbi:MAG: hypothetical protein MJ184_03045 [Treponema sp.]|uniref:hypothetical protein n=1 Tax=Treponema sp. TaxID=166 RepID=UPI00298EB021|nr:hypothetical protein [Treponema sp.]MCQ2600318.1 hypothetical protein [Treponema sp.]
MKKLHFVTILIFSLFLCSTFGEEAKFNELKAKAEEYEKNNQLVHALGTYWDAMGEEPALGVDLTDHFIALTEAISSGKPGLGNYDDFELFDNWVALCEDYEIYWSEHPDEIFTIEVGKPEKGVVDMEKRTANYTLTVKQTRTKKFISINDAVMNGKYTAFSAHKASWEKTIPEAWPMQTIFKDSKKVPLVKYLTVNFPNKNHVSTYFRLITIGQQFYVTNKSDILINTYLELTDKNNSAACAACFTSLTDLKFADGKSLYDKVYSVPFSSNELKLKLIGEDKHVIATMDAPVKLGFDEYTGMKAFVTIPFKNIKASDMKLLDNNQFYYVVEKFELQPTSLTVTSNLNDYNKEFFADAKKKNEGSPVNLITKNNYVNTDVIRKCNDIASLKKDYLKLTSKSEEISNDFSCMQMKGSAVLSFFFKTDVLTDDRRTNAESRLKAMSGFDYKYNESTQCFERPFTEQEKEKASQAKKSAGDKAKSDTDNYINNMIKVKKILVACAPVPTNVFEYLMGYRPDRSDEYVVNVNFYEMMMFCNKLSEYQGLTPVYSIDGTTDVSKWELSKTNNYSTSKTVVTNSKANGYKITDYNQMVEAKNNSKEIKYREDDLPSADSGEFYTQGKQFVQVRISFYSLSSPKSCEATNRINSYTFRVMRNK